jgi:uncharacterized protein YjbI with pentapeptide repeats
VVLLLAALFAVVALSIVYQPWDNEPLPKVQERLQAMKGGDLEAEKLREEIVKLELENRSAGSVWGLLLSHVPFLTLVVAGAGAFAAIWRQTTEWARQRDLDRNQREAESQRHFDANFTNVVRNLGSASPALRASAAVSLTTFLKPRYGTFHDQVYLIVLANLKIQHDEIVNALLVHAFEQAIRIRLQSASPEDRPYVLNLSRVTLDRADLSGLDLSEADMAYARMRNANLTGASLRRARGVELDLTASRLLGADLSEARLRKAHCRDAQFNGANLISARLEEGELQGARFQRARLQSAHFNGAQLLGSRFEGADVNDAFFLGAVLDERALKSIATGARNWRNAHFDSDIEGRLTEISQTTG